MWGKAQFGAGLADVEARHRRTLRGLAEGFAAYDVD
jgi:hypothetical protein